MARRITYGKTFKKKGTRGKFRRGTSVRYKYINGKRVGTVKAPTKRRRK